MPGTRIIKFSWVTPIIELVAMIIFVVLLIHFFPSIMPHSHKYLANLVLVAIVLVFIYQMVLEVRTSILSVTFHANDTVEFHTLLGRKAMPVTALRRLKVQERRRKPQNTNIWYPSYRPGRVYNRFAWLYYSGGNFCFYANRDDTEFWEFLAEVRARHPRLQMDDYFYKMAQELEQRQDH